jgi:TrpR-related protein YerC/YecD
MNWKSKENKALIQAFLALKTAGEARRFLRDLLTEGEIEEFGKRLLTARLLKEKVPYSKIEVQTGLSSTTIARVASWLRRGGGGYRLVLGRLKKN